jgi:CYTH domain-containing protein
MNKEIERKFLVKNHDFKKFGRGVLIQQGFLSTVKERIVRIRIMGNQAFLTIKGISIGFTRNEFEYEIPAEDAEMILKELCEKPIIEKNRYRIKAANLVWEVDEFKGVNEGLIIAEIELLSEDQAFDKPEWIGEEVTDDPRYYNSNLIRYPYSEW